VAAEDPGGGTRHSPDHLNGERGATFLDPTESKGPAKTNSSIRKGCKLQEDATSCCGGKE